MIEVPRTMAKQLVRVAEIGIEAGLHFVYAGNAPGSVGEWENTRCPDCRATLIERYGYAVRDYRLTPGGQCPDCKADIPGIWHRGGAVDVPYGTFSSRVPKRVILD